MKNIIISFLSCLLICSCTKEEADIFQEPYDTIFPEPYLPVYPGSFWSYNSGAVIYKSSDTYILNSFVYSIGLAAYESRPCYVPYWRGFPVYRYASPIGWRITEGIPSDTKQYDLILNFLSLKVNDTWKDSSVITRYSGYWTALDVVKNIDTTIQIGNRTYNNVIVVEHRFGMSGSERKDGKYYYAKDVGLIRVDDPQDSVFMLLDTFNINH